MVFISIFNDNFIASERHSLAFYCGIKAAFSSFPLRKVEFNVVTEKVKITCSVLVDNTI